MSHMIILDQEKHQFRVHLEGEHYATVTFIEKDNVYIMTTTKIPEALQGRGFGKVMMEAVLSEIEQLGMKVQPICSYVVHYMSRNPQWSHLQV